MTDLRRKIWILIRGGSFRGYLRTVSGYPLTLPDCMADKPVSLAVSGNTVQDGTPTPDNPVEVRGVGDYEEPYGYKVPLRFSGKNLFDVDKFVELVKQYDSTAYEDTIDGRHCIVFSNTSLYAKDSSEVAQFGNSAYTMRMDVKNVVPPTAGSGILYIGYLYNGEPCTTNITYVYPSVATSNRYRALTPSNYADFKAATIASAHTDEATATGFAFSYGTLARWAIDIDSIMLEQSGTATTYEPYHEPVTFPIYLDTPLYGNGGVSDTVELDVEHRTATLARRWKVFKNIVPKKMSSADGYARYSLAHHLAYSRNNNFSYCSHLSYVYATTNNQHFYSGKDAIYFWLPEDTDIQAFCNEAVFVLPLPEPQVEDISDKIDWDAIPKLWRGTVIVSADTTVEPSNIIAKYYADKPQGGE